MRRNTTRKLLGLVTMALIASVGSSFLLPSPATAQETPLCETNNSADADEPEFYVTKVAGLIDPVVYRHLLNELDKAEGAGAAGFVLWMNSAGTTISDEQFQELAGRLRETELETGIWVGNSVGNRGRSKADAKGGAAELVHAVDRLALAPGAEIGETGPSRLGEEFENKFGRNKDELEGRIYSAELAIEEGISEGPLERVADIKQFLAGFDNFKTTECLTDARATVFDLQTPVRFSGLSMTSQLFHTAASPQVAYLFFVLGLGLLIFELFTAGVGLAGVTGAGFTLLGSYGLANLPTRLWALALILISMAFIAIDIQTNLPRLYSALGLASFTVGSIFIYDGLSPSIVTLVVSIACAAIYIYTAMPSMVRARFSTPTIGRSWMIGEIGSAITDVSPEGEVKINKTPWKAITNRATPIKSGDNIRVIGIDRLMLEVEPEEGGAKDYRE